MSSTVDKYFDRLTPFAKDFLVAETDAEFDEAFDNWLVHSISHIEAGSKDFVQLGEDGISKVLAGCLNNGIIVVTRETCSNGHVDLTVEVPNSTKNWKKLGEAKIWNGNKYHTDGLVQLLNRYTTGRECRGFVISYVKIKNIKGLFEELRKYIDENKSCDLVNICKDHNIRWSFLSSHNHSSGELVEVCHVGCNLHVPTKS